MTQDKFQGMNLMIGERTRLARKEAGLTQQNLAEKLGLKSRQILDNIETGIRKVTADELLAIMDALKKPLDFFTDPFLITSENVFSWRANREDISVDAYEAKMRNVVAAYCRFGDLLGESQPATAQVLRLSAIKTYEDASQTGQKIVEDWNLGDVPADRMKNAVQDEMNVAVLYIDAPESISGAACHLPEADFILINRKEPSHRCNFSFAHEIFHLLTWDELPPDRIDFESFGKQRKEQLANNFASALLMPEDALKKYWEEHASLEFNDRIRETAKHFKVSGKALYYRLKNLSLIGETASLHLDELRIKWNSEEPMPRLYSEAFVKRLQAVLKKGHVSVRKTSKLLDCMIEDLEDLILDYGMKSPFVL